MSAPYCKPKSEKGLTWNQIVEKRYRQHISRLDKTNPGDRLKLALAAMAHEHRGPPK